MSRIVLIACLGLAGGCTPTRDIAYVDAERWLDAYCPATPEEIFELAERHPAAAHDFVFQGQPTPGHVDSVAAALTVDGDLASVPSLRFVLDPYTLPDLEARLDAQVPDSIRARIEPGYPFPGCTTQGAHGPLAVQLTLDGATQTVVGVFTWVERFASRFEGESVDIGFMTAQPQDGVRILTPSSAEFDGHTWEHDHI